MASTRALGSHHPTSQPDQVGLLYKYIWLATVLQLLPTGGFLSDSHGSWVWAICSPSPCSSLKILLSRFHCNSTVKSVKACHSAEAFLLNSYSSRVQAVCTLPPSSSSLNVFWAPWAPFWATTGFLDLPFCGSLLAPPSQRQDASCELVFSKLLLLLSLLLILTQPLAPSKREKFRKESENLKSFLVSKQQVNLR